MKPNDTRRPDAAKAFLPDDRIVDDEAEALAEEFIEEATSAEHVGEDARDEISPDESGALTVMYDPSVVEELDVGGWPPVRRGFAAMDPERVREIARKGGTAAHRLGTAHRFTTEEARVAGRKGGSAPHRTRRRATTS